MAWLVKQRDLRKVWWKVSSCYQERRYKGVRMEKFKDIKDYINETFPELDSFKGEPLKKKAPKRQRRKNRRRMQR